MNANDIIRTNAKGLEAAKLAIRDSKVDRSGLDPAKRAEVYTLADSWARAYAAAGFLHLCTAERAKEVAMDKGPTVTSPRGGTFAAWTPDTAESKAFVRRFLQTFNYMVTEVQS